MKVIFLLDRGIPPRLSPVFADAASFLESQGVSVTMCFPENELTRIDHLTVGADLYLLKSNTSLAFALATVLHHQGARLVNRLEACRAVRDKVVTAATQKCPLCVPFEQDLPIVVASNPTIRLVFTPISPGRMPAKNKTCWRGIGRLPSFQMV